MLLKLTLLLFAPILVVFGVPWLRRAAPSLGLVQQANDRSSHSGERASGAGVVLAGATMLAGFLLALTLKDASLAFPIAAISILAFVGFADDLFDLSVRARLAAQTIVLAALIVMSGILGPLTDLPLLFALVLIVLTLAAVFFVNIYNFMDGIDGIAATQAAFMLVAILGLVAVQNQQTPAILTSANWLYATSVCLSAVAFLIFNWSRAQIFGGDAAAYLYSTVILFASAIAIAHYEVSWAALAILPGAFISDGCVTLLTRLANGQKFWQAHRTHAYQHLGQKWGHARTVLVFIAYNILWIGPLATLVQLELINNILGLGVAYAPVIVFVVRNGAGRQI